ncbi:MAG TPA: choice-of-anchor D domain-containing protein [Candidatus Acidoferrales bacterium]
MKKTFPLVLFVVVFIGMTALGDRPGARNPPRKVVQNRVESRTAQLPSNPVLTDARAHEGQSLISPRSESKSRESIAESVISASGLFELAAQNTSGNELVSTANGMEVDLTSKGIVVRTASTQHSPPSALQISLRGSESFIWQGDDRVPGETNYFIGNDPTKWRTHVARYRRAETIRQHGVQLAIHSADQGRSAEKGIEYDIYTDVGVDPEKLHFEFRGAHNVRVDRRGDLLMRVGEDDLRMRAPTIYEQISASATATHRKTTSGPRTRRSTSSHSRVRGAHRETMPRKSTRASSNSENRRVRKSMHDYPQRPRKRSRKKTPPTLPLGDQSGASKPRQSGRRIDGGYVLEADGSVGFWIGKHDPNAALLIDPSLTVTYASFLGGSGADSVNSMAMDSAGNVYVAGTTSSAATFPEAPNGVEGNIRGAGQLFLAKIAFSNGIGTLQYLTFFGGSNAQAGGEVAVDGSGNAAVLGTTTSPDYPVTDGRTPTPGLTSGTGNDLTISEVDPTGANLILSTLFGGSGTESANAATGTALTSSLNIPAGQGGIAFDVSGNIYVASDTSSQDLPTTGGAYQGGFGGKSRVDGFVAEFQPQNVAAGGSDLLYCSYLGTNSDGAVAIGGVAVDAETPPGVYIAGSTNNSIDGFPPQYAFQTAYGGGSSDAFLMKMQLAGTNTSDLIYATLLGGSGMDEALGVTVDAQGSAYVVGATQSPTFPETPTVAGPSTKEYQPVPAPPLGAPPIQNAFLAIVGWNSGQTTTLQYFTYLGGAGQDAAESVAAPSPTSVYVGGTTTSYNFGWRDNLQPFNGAADAFVVKLDATQPGARSLLYATPLGGTFVTPGAVVTAFGNGIAADGHGDVYVAGQTAAASFPTAMTTSSTLNGFQEICESCQEQPAKGDAFIAGIQEGTATEPAVSFGSASVNFASGGVQIGTSALPQPFAILNTGEGPLSLSTVNPPVVTGANGGDFSVTLASGAGCPQPLSPGQTCQAELNFVPSAAGVEGGVVTINDDAPGSPQLLEVTGIGVGPLTMSPSSFAFGSVPFNTPGVQDAIGVTVTAGVQIDNFTIGLPEPGNAAFSPAAPVLNPCQSGVTLAAGSSCSIWYGFTPQTAGEFSAQLNVTGEINGAPISEVLPLTGTGIPAVPAMVALPTQLAFRNVSIGSIEVLPVVLSNPGAAPLVVSRPIGFSGTNASEFSETDDCPASIPAHFRDGSDSSCTVSVEFSPQTVGSKIASLVIADNAAGSPELIALSGTAIAPPQAQVSPSTWNFGNLAVGTQSLPELFTITNAGSSTLNFTQAIGISGTNAADFQQTNNCPTSVAAGSSCSVSVVFLSQTAGADAATLNIANNAPGSPQSVSLSGTGTSSAQAKVSPSSLTFGAQVTGTESAAQAVTIENTGSSSLTFGAQAITFSGPNFADFAESDDCQQTSLAPNLSCTVFVRFAPQSTGSKTATLVITNSASNSPQTVALAGTATAPPSIQIAPPSLTFTTPESVGAQSASQVVTVTNEGTIPIAFTQAMTISGPNSADFSQTTNCNIQSGLQPGSQCTISVAFAPTASGTRVATLTIADSASGSPQSIPLTGTGVQANAQISPTVLTFGNQPVATTSAAQTVTVTSAGPGQPLAVSKVSFGGTNAVDFAESDNCSGPITSSCAIQVTFTPSCQNEPAARAATLTIQDNGAVPSETIALTGTATGDFCISAGSSSLNQTVAAGVSASFSPISMISVNSFSGMVNLACTSNPSGPTCTLAPSAAVTVSPNLPAQLQVQVATTASSVMPVDISFRGGNWDVALPCLIVAFISVFAVGRRSGRLVGRIAFTAAAVSFLCLGLAACGGGGRAQSNASSDPPPSLAGSYTLSVTANDGSQSQTLSLHLNVTP